MIKYAQCLIFLSSDTLSPKNRNHCYNRAMKLDKKQIRLAPDVRKRMILKAAAALFIERGFEAVDMGSIAERAAIARPTVYKYFASTEVILSCLLDDALDALWIQLQPVLGRASEIGSEQTYREVFAVLLKHPDILKLLHSGGGPLFQKYRHTLLFERLAQQIHLQLPPEDENPYKRLIDSVLLESLAFWAVLDPSLDVELLGRTIAATLKNKPAENKPAEDGSKLTPSPATKPKAKARAKS